MLELSIPEVPDFCAPGFNGRDWWSGFQKWLGDRGLAAVEIELQHDRPKIAPLPDGLHVIVSGKSPRADFLHSVVAVTRDNDFKMIHDPHESGAGVDGSPKQLLFFVPFRRPG